MIFICVFPKVIFDIQVVQFCLLDGFLRRGGMLAQKDVEQTKGASIKYICTEGEGEWSQMRLRSKGVCMNLVLQIWQKCVEGGSQ